MFAAMYKSFLNESQLEKNKLEPEIEKSRQNVENLLTDLCEVNDSSYNVDSSFTLKDTSIESIESSFADIHLECSNDIDSVHNFDDSKSDISSINENKLEVTVQNENPDNKRLMNQINSLQCPFTWNLKPKHKKMLITRIQNKYGEYNLDISSNEFTLQRYIGNLIIGYEMFRSGKPNLAQIKISEIGKWLEELDKTTDTFYLSINSGLLHVLKSTFIHILYATNSIEECKLFIGDIASFANIDPKSRATIHALHAAILTEYEGDANDYKKACECAKKACELDPSTSHWFYIYSLALTAQRKFLQSFKSNPTENEISAIEQAVKLSGVKNILFEYKKMLLKLDAINWNFHNNKNTNHEVVFQKNLKDNKTIIKMIKTIIYMGPKDPHIVINCARTLITLPFMIRDLNLGKEYLIKALNMAPTDVSVIKAIERVLEVNKNLSKNNNHSTNESKKKPSLREELRFIVIKHKNGEDPLPYLIVLLNKFDGHDKLKIMSQICSYTILFTKNLRAGVEQFLKLIEHPEMVNKDLITEHYSTFGSKKFNLAELICNEIRLATNSSGSSSEDMLFYFKMLTLIVETYNLEIKDADSSMKSKLIDILPRKLTCQSKSDLLDIDNVDDKNIKNINIKQKPKKKHLSKPGPKGFDVLSQVKNKPKTKNGSQKNNVQTKTHQTNANDIDQLKSKMLKFFNSSPAEENKSSDNSNRLTTESLKNLQTHAELHNYTQQLYKNILSNTQQQHNLHNITSRGLNRFFNQNHANLNSSSQQSPFQNPQTPPLLSLRPQISPETTKPTKQRSKKKMSTKKK